MKKCVYIIIIGKVQNVSYRINAKRKAEEFDLAGWVKNIPDGRVEILAEGKKENLEKMIYWCHNGSDYAIVSEVKIEWVESEEKFDKFRILV